MSLWTFHLFQHVQNKKQQVQTVWQFDFFHYFQPSFSSAAPTIWNSLPEPIRNHDDISNFKTYMKTFLFKEHFN